MVRVKLATSLNILGFLNHEHMQRRNPHAKGTNPCFCGDMRLLTTDGYKTFKELEGKEFTNISYDGSTSKGKVWSNGIKNTVKIKLSTNETIICTPDHRLMTADNEEMEAQHTVGRRLKTFVAKNAATNDEFIKLGFIQGDGVLTRLASPDRKGIEVIIGAKDEEILPYFDNDKYTTRATRAKIIYVQTVKERMLDLGFTPYISAERSFPTTYNQWEDIEKKSFLKGCFSANGTVIRKYRVAYKTTSKQFADQLIEALAEFNIGAYMTTNKSKNVVFSNGEYTCRESYDVNVGKYRDVVRFAEEIGFVHSEKNIALAELIDLKSPKVMSIRPHKPIEVFDFHEPNNHWGVVEGLVAHNCGEILLDDRQTCNLTEINMSAFVREDGSVDMERMLHAQRLSAKIGYRMATIELELHEWDKAGKKDMLTGCSLSGMADFLNKTQMSNEDFAAVLRKLRKVAREEVDEMAEKLKMGKTLLVTTIKPSGSLSLLPGISAGIHFQHSDYYIRRVRVNEADPLSRAMTEMGFASVPENGQTEENCSTRVFAFPCKAPTGNNKFTVSAIRQLELYKLVMENYVEHNASNTISVRPEEWDETTQWVYDNWNSVVGMTFLELQDEFYQLAPFEKITKEQYESMLATTPKFVAEAANSMEDFSDLLAADIEECANGHCPIR